MKGYYDCTIARVVTSIAFTDQVRALAWKNGVELWDRDDLITALSKVGGE